MVLLENYYYSFFDIHINNITDNLVPPLSTGLSQRANHPSNQLHLLHGSLFNVKCTSFDCDYSREDFTDPIVPALAIPRGVPEPKPSATDNTGEQATNSLYNALGINDKESEQEADISDERVPLAPLSRSELPQCPKCKDGLLRPGVVWFGEPLPSQTIRAVDKWIHSAPKIDLVLVIGTSAKVYPAAGYVDVARRFGAKVAVVNMDPNDVPRGAGSLGSNGWFFNGDAGVIVPQILKSVIGDI